MRGAPGQCHTWMRHGCVSAASRDGTLLHAQAGRNPAARERCDRNSKRPDCLQGRCHSTLRCGLRGRGHLSYPSAASRYCQKHAKSVGSHRHRAPDFHVFSGPIYASGPPYSNGALHVNSPHTSTRLSPYAGAVLPYVSTAGSCYNFIVAASGSA